AGDDDGVGVGLVFSDQGEQALGLDAGDDEVEDDNVILLRPQMVLHLARLGDGLEREPLMGKGSLDEAADGDGGVEDQKAGLAGAVEVAGILLGRARQNTIGKSRWGNVDGLISTTAQHGDLLGWPTREALANAPLPNVKVAGPIPRRRAVPPAA